MKQTNDLDDCTMVGKDFKKGELLVVEYYNKGIKQGRLSARNERIEMLKNKFRANITVISKRQFLEELDRIQYE